MNISKRDIENCMGFSDKTTAIYHSVMPHPDLTHFSYSRSYPDGRRLILESNPNHLEYYLSNDMYKIGNTEYHLLSYQNGFYLTRSFPQQKINHIMEDQFQEYCGVFYILRHPHFCEFTFFAFDKLDITLNNYFINQREKLIETSLLFRKKAQSLIKAADRSSIILSFNECNALNKINPQLDCELNKKLATLSIAELNYIFELRKGGTDKEIAKRSKLSHRTLEKQLLSVRAKLNCHSRSEVEQTIHSCFM